MGKPSFERENRYLVLKRSDMKCLSREDHIALDRITTKIAYSRFCDGKPDFDCVVVESDWPEYEPTWKAIERRVLGLSAMTETEYKLRLFMWSEGRNLVGNELEEEDVIAAGRVLMAESRVCPHCGGDGTDGDPDGGIYACETCQGRGFDFARI